MTKKEQEYVKFLEDKIRKIDSVFGLLNGWLKDQSLNPSRFYMAALKDIRRHVRSQPK